MAFVTPGDINQPGDQQQIADNLKRGMPAGDGHPVRKDHVKKGQRIPENYQRNEVTEWYSDQGILLENNNDSQ